MDATSITTDASHTYRGYRLQSLYILWRILNSKIEDAVIFQPEGVEDLAIYDNDSNLVEVVQVKAYGKKLTLSSFLPRRSESFFYRASAYLDYSPNVVISIIGYGQFGSDLENLSAGDIHTVNSLAQELSGYGLISEESARILFSHIRVETVDEHELSKNLLNILANILTSGDPQTAFELLSKWIYTCSENKSKITRTDIINKINQVGRYINEGAAFSQEWLGNITPITVAPIDNAKHNALADEFYNGMSARYEHILADIDVKRQEKIQIIKDGFDDKSVVIVHGASGQGKSTLAYRFLHDYFPRSCRLEVRTIQDRKHALNVATAISGHARAIGIPILVYIDVASSDLDWPLLVRELVSQANIQILVTIREEDFKRANISGADFQYTSVSLSFNADEAQAIFHSLAVQRPSTFFPTFMDAWNRFGGDGPLMEFVYLVTQNQSLHEKLQQQINRFRDEGRSIAGNSPQIILQLLRLVAVVTSTDSRIAAQQLAKSLDLNDPERVFELLEKEYLLKLTGEGVWIEGLHPIRSRKIAEILTGDLSPWVEVAIIALPIVCEADLQTFLLDSFVNHSAEVALLLDTLETYEPQSWGGIAGVTRALLWFGVREYYVENQALVDEVYEEFGEAGMYLIDFDIVGVAPSAVDAAQQLLEILKVPQAILTKRDEFMARQTDKQQAFSRAKLWLSSRSKKPSTPLSNADWTGLAEVLLWINRLQISWPLGEWFIEINLRDIVHLLPLDILGDVMLGFSHGYVPAFENLKGNFRSIINSRFKDETRTISLDDDGQKLTAHFMPDIFAEQKQFEAQLEQSVSENRLHSDTIWRIELLAKLYPDRSVFACQGYGHKFSGFELPFDDTYKEGIERKDLPQWWLTWVNSAFRVMTRFPHRPDTWKQYVEDVLDTRETVCETLEQCEERLRIYFRTRKYLQLTELINEVTKPELLRMLNRLSLFPQSAIDELEVIDESSTNKVASVQARFAHRSIAIQPYLPLLEVFRKYTSSLINFFQQSQHAIILNPMLGRSAKTEVQKANITQKVAEMGVDPQKVRLGVLNFTSAVQTLPDFQRQFRYLLAQYVEIDRLNALEQREQELFPSVWSVWYFFAFSPEEVQNNASVIFPRRVKNVGQRLRHNLKIVLKELSKESLNFRLLDQECSWENNSVLCLIMDGLDAVEVYNSIEQTLIPALRTWYAEFSDHRLRDQAISFTWSFLIVIPLLRGRLLDEFAWKLPFHLFTSNDEINWWHAAPQHVPLDMMERLNNLDIERLDYPELTKISDLRQNVSVLQLLVAHINDLMRLSELSDDEGSNLQSYINQMMVKVNEILQLILDSIANMLNETLTKYGTSSFVSLLEELHQNVLPVEVTDDIINIELQIQEFSNWLKALAHAQLVVQTIYLRSANLLLEKEIGF